MTGSNDKSRRWTWRTVGLAILEPTVLIPLLVGLSLLGVVLTLETQGATDLDAHSTRRLFESRKTDDAAPKGDEDLNVISASQARDLRTHENHTLLAEIASAANKVKMPDFREINRGRLKMFFIESMIDISEAKVMKMSQEDPLKLTEKMLDDYGAAPPLLESEEDAKEDAIMAGSLCAHYTACDHCVAGGCAWCLEQAYCADNAYGVCGDDPANEVRRVRWEHQPNLKPQPQALLCGLRPSQHTACNTRPGSAIA
jgi:hypothetical protein